MMTFFTANLATIIIVLLLGVLVFLAIRRTVRSRKNNQDCGCGCGAECSRITEKYGKITEPDTGEECGRQKSEEE